MDILAEDLGTTEIIKLFGERLKTAREKNIDLEKRLAAKTIECDANLRRAQHSDGNRAALRQELHRASVEAPQCQSSQEPGTCTNPQHAFDITTKSQQVEELTAQLRVKSETEKGHLEALDQCQNALTICKQKYKDTKRQHSEAEKGHLEALDELQNALAICKQKYKDAKRQLKEAREQMQIDDPATSMRQTIDFVAKFASTALPNQQEEQIKRKFITSALPISPSGIQDHMAKKSPSSQFHCSNQVATRVGVHHWLAGPLHRAKFDVEQQHWKNAEWIPQSQFKKLHGKTIEVFSQSIKGKTIYLGRHKAIPLKNLHSNQFGELPQYMRRSLIDSVISQTGWINLEGYNGGRAIISRLLNRGTIQIECLGLQFDSFDKKLNASINELARQIALQSNTPGSLGQRQVKKRKMDEVNSESESDSMIESASDAEMEE